MYVLKNLYNSYSLPYIVRFDLNQRSSIWDLDFNPDIEDFKFEISIPNPNSETLTLKF